jgi:hypothetical protein
VKVVALDERLAKAAILGLNSLQQATRELEEAWSGPVPLLISETMGARKK